MELTRKQTGEFLDQTLDGEKALLNEFGVMCLITRFPLSLTCRSDAVEFRDVVIIRPGRRAGRYDYFWMDFCILPSGKEIYFSKEIRRFKAANAY